MSVVGHDVINSKQTCNILLLFWFHFISFLFAFSVGGLDFFFPFRFAFSLLVGGMLFGVSGLLLLLLNFLRY